MAIDYAPGLNAYILERLAGASGPIVIRLSKYVNEIADTPPDPVGDFTISTPIRVPASTYGCVLDGAGVVIKLNSDFDYQIIIGNNTWGSGAITQWSAYTRHDVSPALKGDTTITIPSKPSLGSTFPLYVMLYGNTFLTYSAVDYYVHQELVRIDSYDQATGIATLSTGLRRAFPTSGGTTPKIALIHSAVSVGSGVRNIVIDSKDMATSARTQEAIWFGGVVNGIAENVTVRGFETDAIRFEFCRDCVAKNLIFDDSVTSGASLGRCVAINNSSGIRVAKGWFTTEARHGATVSMGSMLTTLEHLCVDGQMGDAFIDVDHGFACEDTATRDCCGGDYQAGNGTFSKGGTGHTIERCTFDDVRFIGEVTDVTVDHMRCENINFQGTDYAGGRYPQDIAFTDCTVVEEHSTSTDDPLSFTGFSDGDGSTASVTVTGITFTRCSFGTAASAGGRRCVLAQNTQNEFSVTFTDCSFTNPGTGKPIRITAGSGDVDMDFVASGSKFITGATHAIEFVNEGGLFTVGSSHAITNTTRISGAGTDILNNAAGVSGSTPT